MDRTASHSSRECRAPPPRADVAMRPIVALKAPGHRATQQIRKLSYGPLHLRRSRCFRTMHLARRARWRHAKTTTVAMIKLVIVPDFTDTSDTLPYGRGWCLMAKTRRGACQTSWKGRHRPNAGGVVNVRFRAACQCLFMAHPGRSQNGDFSAGKRDSCRSRGTGRTAVAAHRWPFKPEWVRPESCRHCESLYVADQPSHPDL